MKSTAKQIFENKYYSIGLILLLTFGVYFNSLFNKYALDDFYVTAQNPEIREGIKGIPHIFQSPYGTDGNGKGFEYRPIVKLTFAIEYELFGENVTINHLVNLLLYLLNVLLVYLFLLKFISNKNNILLFISTLFFALLPIHTEVVDNLKSRDDLLSLIFALICIITAIGNKNIYTKLVLCSLLFVLALLSKLTSISLIVILPLILFFKQNTNDYKIPALLFGILLLIGGAYSYTVISIFNLSREVNFSENPIFYSTLSERLGTTMLVLLYYIKLLLLPGEHSFYFGYNMVPVIKLTNSLSILSILIHSGMLIWALYNIKKRHVLAFAILFYLIAIFPFSNFAFPVVGILAERFTYLASIGFCIALAWLFVFITDKLSSKKTLMAYLVAPALLCAYYAYDIVDRNKDWKDLLTLYVADIGHLQKSTHANYLYASSLQSLADLANTPDERNRLYNKALKYYKNVNAKYWEAQKNIANIHYALGNNTLALQYIRNAYNLSPEVDRKDVLMKRLVIEEANGNFDENIKLLNEGLKKEPENVDYNYYLMRNHLFLNNDTAAASRYAREVIKIDKNGYLANRAYGLLFIIKGDIANNIKYSELAFEQNPEDNELGNYLYNYYKSQNNSLKEKYYDEAIKKQKSKSTF